MVWTARRRDGAMNCCWLWLFAYVSFLVDGRLGCWPRRVSPSGLQRTGRRAEHLGVKLGFPRSSCRAIISDMLCMRSYCMRVCICVYVCMCADMIYVHTCMCTSMRLYTCVCVCVCIFVHRLWVLVSVLERVDGVMHAHVFSCAYVCVYVCVWVYVYMHLCAVSVTCTLQVF